MKETTKCHHFRRCSYNQMFNIWMLSQNSSIRRSWGDTKLAFSRLFHFIHTIFLTPDLPWLWYCPDALTLVLSRPVKLTTVINHGPGFTPLFWKSWFQKYHAVTVSVLTCIECAMNAAFKITANRIRTPRTRRDIHLQSQHLPPGH